MYTRISIYNPTAQADHIALKNSTRLSGLDGAECRRYRPSRVQLPLSDVFYDYLAEALGRSSTLYHHDSLYTNATGHSQGERDIILPVLRYERQRPVIVIGSHQPERARGIASSDWWIRGSSEEFNSSRGTVIWTGSDSFTALATEEVAVILEVIVSQQQEARLNN